MEDKAPSLDEQQRRPLHVQDYDGKIYERLASGQVLRRSPKMRGKDRRLARSVAKMMGGQK